VVEMEVSEQDIDPQSGRSRIGHQLLSQPPYPCPGVDYHQAAR